MRILMLSDLETSGGAAIAASRLAHGLAPRHEILRCVLHPDPKPHPWKTRTLGGTGFLTRQFFRVARRLLNPAWYRPWCRRGVLKRLAAAVDGFRPDVINVHNLHGGWDRGWGAEMVDLCARRAPTVWTLHDMWSFTGRCAYSYDCRRFESGCDAHCPTPGEYPALSPTAIEPAWQEKRDLLNRHSNLVAVSPSRWLADEARVGIWKPRSVVAIPNGLPLDVYRPHGREDARRRLGLPTKGLVLLLVAQSLAERRKGGDRLSSLWGHVAARPLTIACMGNGTLPAAEGIDIHPLGFIRDPERHALVYAAADLLVHPAPVDNLPNVVLEALACGTPVVGFPIGGMPEMVRPDVSGWLAKEMSAPALGAAVDSALGAIQDGETLRDSSRELAEREYDLTIQAQRYEDLFRNLLARRAAA